jgi:hypothetical protein
VTVSGLPELGDVEKEVAASDDVKAEDDDLANAYETLRQGEEEASINLVEQERSDQEKFDNDDIEWHLDAADEIREGKSDEYDEGEVQQYFEDQRELGLWDDANLDQAEDQAQVEDSGSGGVDSVSKENDVDSDNDRPIDQLDEDGSIFGDVEDGQGEIESDSIFGDDGEGDGNDD